MERQGETAVSFLDESHKKQVNENHHCIKTVAKGLRLTCMQNIALISIMGDMILKFYRHNSTALLLVKLKTCPRKSSCLYVWEEYIHEEFIGFTHTIALDALSLTTFLQQKFAGLLFTIVLHKCKKQCLGNSCTLLCPLIKSCGAGLLQVCT